MHRGPRTQLFRGLTQSRRNITHLLSTKELRARLLNYVAATQRMRSVYGNIPAIDERGTEDEPEEQGEGEEDTSDEEPEEEGEP